MQKWKSMDLKNLFKKLIEEGEKHKWGFLLIRRQEFNNFIQKILDRFKELKILDVGSWSCLMKGYLIQQFPKFRRKIYYVGIDIVNVKNRRKDVDFVQCSGEYLPFKPTSFNAVIFIESLEHIVDYVKALKEAYLVLKENGGLFIQAPRCTEKHAINDQTHIHVLHCVTLSRLLQILGFNNVKCVDGHNFAVSCFK